MIYKAFQEPNCSILHTTVTFILNTCNMHQIHLTIQYNTIHNSIQYKYGAVNQPVIQVLKLLVLSNFSQASYLKL